MQTNEAPLPPLGVDGDRCWTCAFTILTSNQAPSRKTKHASPSIRRSSPPPHVSSSGLPGWGREAEPHPREAHTPSLTRVQLLGGRAELGIFRDSVGDIRAFGRSPRCTEACGLGYSIRQVVKI